MKKLFFLVLSVLPFASYAQPSADNLKITLQQAIDLGLTNRFDIQANKYNLAIADSRVNKSKKEWVPDITGSGNVRYSPQIQATYIPAGFLGSSAGLVALGAKST